MARATSIVDINGTSYNAATGDVIGSVRRLAQQSGAGVIDGFVRTKKSGAAKIRQVSTAKPAPASTKPAAAARALRTKHTSAKTVHHRTERSRTLVRNAVARPSLRIKAAVKTFSRPTPAAATLNTDRSDRAKNIAKHTAVKRFGAPTAQTSNEPQAQTTAAVETKSVTVRPRADQSATTANPLPSMVTSASHHQLERMLDQALTTANAHKQQLKAHRHRGFLGKFRALPTWLHLSAAIIIVLVSAGVVAWRYFPQVSVKLAAQQSNVNATMPSYTPTGFAFSNTSYQPGVVAIEYKDKLKDARYTLTEKRSDMDSTAIAANSIAKGTTVQTSQVGGTTVYIYGPTNDATWANNGNHYTIKNHAGLNSDQLLRIVQSL